MLKREDLFATSAGPKAKEAIEKVHKVFFSRQPTDAKDVEDLVNDLRKDERGDRDRWKKVSRNKEWTAIATVIHDMGTKGKSFGFSKNARALRQREIDDMRGEGN